jgi:hypothetical protein
MNRSANDLKQVEETPREVHTQELSQPANPSATSHPQPHRRQESRAPKATPSRVDQHRESKNTAQTKPSGKSPKTKRISGEAVTR